MAAMLTAAGLPRLRWLAYPNSKRFRIAAMGRSNFLRTIP